MVAMKRASGNTSPMDDDTTLYPFSTLCPHLDKYLSLHVSPEPPSTTPTSSVSKMRAGTFEAGSVINNTLLVDLPTVETVPTSAASAITTLSSVTPCDEPTSINILFLKSEVSYATTLAMSGF